jgi:uncharacterized membrane protein
MFLPPRDLRESVSGRVESNLGATSSGLDANVAAALTYAIGWVTGVAFLFFEHENNFVRFHAIQSIIVFGGLSLAWMIALSVPFFGWIVAFLIIPPVSAVLWLVLMYKAYQGERYKVPGAGEMAEQRF